jgi:hypothetical protein
VADDDPLARVKRAHTRLERASREYREALLNCQAAGITYADLGRELGISRQAVRQNLTRTATANEALAGLPQETKAFRGRRPDGRLKSAWLLGCPSGLHANDGRCNCHEMPPEGLK